MHILRGSPAGAGGGGGGRAPLSISPPQNLAHRLQHVLKLWSIFFTFYGCLVFLESFGFVFVWVLVLSFTYAIYELIFLRDSRLFLACVQTDVCTQANLFSVRFFSECVEFPLSLFSSTILLKKVLVFAVLNIFEDFPSFCLA